MRCKNCGFENDDKHFICENCGSPLYDENEPIVDNDPTTVLNSQAINSYNNENDIASQGTGAPAPQPNNGDDEKKKQQQMILIIALVVILVVIVAGVIFGIVKSTSKNDTTTSTSTTQSSTSTTETTTQAQTTTKKAESTTTSSFAVGVSCNAGGSVSGDGIYTLGENATVVAKVDNGYEFDGWYKGSTKVSSSTKYTFTVTENISLKAVFKVVETETEPESSTEPITVQ